VKPTIAIPRTTTHRARVRMTTQPYDDRP
jgi:hypothetical protein